MNTTILFSYHKHSEDGTSSLIERIFYDGGNTGKIIQQVYVPEDLSYGRLSKLCLEVRQIYYNTDMNLETAINYCLL